MSTAWTNKSILLWTTEFFSKHGISSPRLNAETLLAAVLGIDRVKIYMNWDKPLEKSELKHLKELIKRRVSKEPLQYILGYQDFWTVRLDVNPSVLIPRQDSEVIVESVIDVCGKQKESSIRILDICTGSGNLALAIASEFKNASVIGADISSAALQTAKKNAHNNKLEDRVSFETGDLFNIPISSPFDIIVSNPPYIPTDEINSLSEEIRMHEPTNALDGGLSGLIFYEKILKESPKYLKNDAVIFLEIGDNQAEEVISIFKDSGFSNIELRKDYSDNDRVVFGRWPG